MQYVLDFGIPSPLVIVHDRLTAHYGRDWPVSIRSDPIDHLVFAMTSNRTLGKVSVNAFCKLRAAFRPWDLMIAAPYEEIHAYIRNVTYADTYANFIPAALRLIKEKEGALNLDFLKDWTVPKAQAWLEMLPGVGPKISAYVLNTSRLHMPALIVEGASRGVLALSPVRRRLKKPLPASKGKFRTHGQPKIGKTIIL